MTKKAKRFGLCLDCLVKVEEDLKRQVDRNENNRVSKRKLRIEGGSA
ncbi:MAG: hypothetical protein Q7R67_02635 [bacterium]|nr:hypothetical protein [bacterium]